MSSTEVLAKRRESGRLTAWIASELRNHLHTYATMAAFFVVVAGIAALRGESLVVYVGEYVDRLGRVFKLVICAFVALAFTIGLAKARGGQSPAAIALASLRGIFFSNMAVQFLYSCVLFAFVMGAFLYCKMLIPEVQPFAWDATFAEWDRWLFGTDPWRLLHPVLGTPWATYPLDFFYSSWVPLVFVFWAGLAASPRVPQAVRAQYWFATIVSWIVVGLLMATAFSSAGPCYYTEFVPGAPSPYTELLQYIAQVDGIHQLSSSMAKQMLWDSYTGQSDLPGGISAMPSMHNAQAVLFAAVAYRLNRAFGHAMAAYALLIFIGSIHLGWHYAVDGIVAAVAALAIWTVAGRVIQRRSAAR